MDSLSKRDQERCRSMYPASTPHALMALCINPACSSPNHPDNSVHSHCQTCGANLILQERYRVMRLLTDRSGFGRVYEIFERDQPKILKILKETYNSNPKAIQLFEQEALVLGHLNHPGVPRIDVDGCFQVTPVEGGAPLHCIVMEKIDGPNLSEWMRQQGNHPISEPQAVQWLQQLVEVLHLVHQQRYFHRDIKPDNIMIRSSGQLVLVDFGAVREMSFTYFEQLEATGGITRISSAGYTPPEQERGQAVPQSDFFSLGCTFIYLLTGKKPTDVDIYNSMTNEYIWRPFAPHISAQLADFVDRLAAPRVVDRPTSTLELLAKVNQLQLAIGQGVQEMERRAGEFGAMRINRASPPQVLRQNAMPHTGHPANHPATDQRITLPPSYAPTGYPNTIVPTTATQSQAAIAASAVPLGSQPYEVYESSSIPAEAEPYAEAKSGETADLVHHPVSTAATMNPSSHLRQWFAWRWVGLGVGVALGVAAIWGGRSLHRSLFPPSAPAVAENLEADLNTTEPEPASADTSSLAFTLVSELRGHSGSVNSLALSLDGQTLVSGSNDKTVRIWDLATGEERHQLVGHGDRVHTVAISPNGQLVASGGGDAVIKLWDKNTGEAIADLTGHTSSISDLIITPDGQTLISTSADKTIKLWNLTTRTEIATLRGHSSFINSLSLSPDGTLLASGAADRTIKLWNLTTQQPLATLTGHSGYVNTVAFSLDGNQLISGGADNQIKLWDLRTYQAIATLEQHTSFVNALKMVPDGRSLVSTSADETLIVWDLATQQPIQTIPWAKTFINTVVIRINGTAWQLIAGGEGNHTIQVWNVER